MIAKVCESIISCARLREHSFTHLLAIGADSREPIGGCKHIFLEPTAKLRKSERNSDG